MRSGKSGLNTIEIPEHSLSLSPSLSLSLSHTHTHTHTQTHKHIHFCKTGISDYIEIGKRVMKGILVLFDLVFNIHRENLLMYYFHEICICIISIPVSLRQFHRYKQSTSNKLSPLLYSLKPLFPFSNSIWWVSSCFLHMYI
jgi:hypothetical protein